MGLHYLLKPQDHLSHIDNLTNFLQTLTYLLMIFRLYGYELEKDMHYVFLFFSPKFDIK